MYACLWISHSNQEIETWIFKLFRISDISQLDIIWEPFYSILLKINTHSNYRFFLQPKLTSQCAVLSSHIYSSPKSQSYKMFAINVGIMLQKSITKPHDHVIIWSLNFELKINFALLLNRMRTIHNSKIRVEFDQFIRF